MMNWGTKLLIGMGLFMAFIVTLGTAMVMSNDDALIDKNYYEKGLNYDKDYNEQQNAVRDSVVPAIEVKQAGLVISFPAAAQYKLTCKRLSDATLDKTFTGYSDANGIVGIAPGVLAAGPWMLNMRYRIQDKDYLIEREVVIR